MEEPPSNFKRSKRETLHNEYDAHRSLYREKPPLIVQELMDKYKDIFQSGLDKGQTQDFLLREFKVCKAVGLGEEEITQELTRALGSLSSRKLKDT